MPNLNGAVCDMPKHISGLLSSFPYFLEVIYLLNSSTLWKYLKTSFSVIFGSSSNSQKCEIIFCFISSGKFWPISAICLIFLHCFKKYKYGIVAFSSFLISSNL